MLVSAGHLPSWPTKVGLYDRSMYIVISAVVGRIRKCMNYITISYPYLADDINGGLFVE